MPKRKLSADDLLRFQVVSDVQIHPSGEFSVGCVKSVRSPSAYRSRLYKFDSNMKAVPLTHGESMDTRPRWSPDGRRLGFLSNRQKPKSQIYVLETEGGEARTLSDVPEGTIGKFQWSPDGNHIAFAFQSKAPEVTSEETDLRKKEERSDPPIVVTNWPYKLDGSGYFRGQKWGLYVLDVQSGEHKCLCSDSENEDLDFCWLSDSSQLAVVMRKGEERFLEPPGNSLFLVSAATGDIKEIETPRWTMSCLSLSPSGSRIAFMFHDRSAEPFGPKATRIGILDVSTLKIEELLRDEDIFLDVLCIGDARDSGEAQLLWCDEETIWSVVANQGSFQLCRIKLSGQFSVYSLPADGELYLGGIDSECSAISGWIALPDQPVEACLIEISKDNPKLKCASNLNSWFREEIEVSIPEPFVCSSPNGDTFQAWKITPSKSNGRAAIEVHGGPAAMYSCALMIEMQLLAANGFTVFFSNVHGSTGYGEAFARSILGDWGNLDWKDVIALTEVAKQTPGVDSAKICILGGSYGGFMVNWAIGHTNQYYRAVTDRCVSNLISKWGNSDYLFVPDGHWPGSVFGNSKVLWECSPIVHFANVKTPTLIIHSEGDLRCNIEQGEQVYAALKILGVETKFVRYPTSTSHGMSRNGPPDLRIHRLNQIIDWVTR